MHVGARKLPLGASCLVILSNLLSCYAQDFAPVPALVEAYLGLLSLTSSLAREEHCNTKPGTRYLRPQGCESTLDNIILSLTSFCLLAALCCLQVTMM